MGLLSSLNSWLTGRNLKQQNKSVINWDEYPHGTVLSCCVLSNGVVSGTLKDQHGELRGFTTYQHEISEAIPAGSKVAYEVRPKDVIPRIKVLKIL